MQSGVRYEDKKSQTDIKYNLKVGGSNGVEEQIEGEEFKRGWYTN